MVTMIYLVIAGMWLGLGAFVGVVEARHGYWRKGWAVSAIFGPFAVPLAIQRHRVARPGAKLLASGRAHRGQVDVLIGVDGSDNAMAAAAAAVGLFGPRTRRVMLATVLDFDTATPHADATLCPEPCPEEVAARELLDAAVAALRTSTGHQPGSVLLAGEPAAALLRYAMDERYEVITVGCRGRGLSKLLLGSCASALARSTTVPVLLVPKGAPSPVDTAAPAWTISA